MTLKEMKTTEKPFTFCEVSFKFPVTLDEAKQIKAKPNGKVAKEFRKYLYDFILAAADKCLEKEKEIKNNKKK